MILHNYVNSFPYTSDHTDTVRDAMLSSWRTLRKSFSILRAVGKVKIQNHAINSPRLIHSKRPCYLDQPCALQAAEHSKVIGGSRCFHRALPMMSDKLFVVSILYTMNYIQTA